MHFVTALDFRCVFELDPGLECLIKERATHTHISPCFFPLALKTDPTAARAEASLLWATLEAEYSYIGCSITKTHEDDPKAIQLNRRGLAGFLDVPADELACGPHEGLQSPPPRQAQRLVTIRPNSATSSPTDNRDYHHDDHDRLGQLLTRLARPAQQAALLPSVYANTTGQRLSLRQQLPKSSIWAHGLIRPSN